MCVVSSFLSTRSRRRSLDEKFRGVFFLLAFIPTVCRATFAKWSCARVCVGPKRIFSYCFYLWLIRREWGRIGFRGRIWHFVLRRLRVLLKTESFPGNLSFVFCFCCFFFAGDTDRRACGDPESRWIHRVQETVVYQYL